MKKNSKINLWLETEMKNAIEKQAREEGISLCEYCRRKLMENNRTVRMDNNIQKIIYILENRKIFKEKPINN